MYKRANKEKKRADDEKKQADGSEKSAAEALNRAAIAEENKMRSIIEVCQELGQRILSLRGLWRKRI